jgi:3-phenylpropionate/cinnamic acid dioxygenase small subunit
MTTAASALHEIYPDICNVLSEVARTADVGDIDEYLALLTDDIVFEFPDNAQVGLAAQVYRGIDEVRGGVEMRRGKGLQGPGTHTLHLISTISARTCGDSVRAFAYWTYYVNTDQTPELRSMGSYDNTLRLSPDGWRLAHRAITIL